MNVDLGQTGFKYLVSRDNQIAHRDGSDSEESLSDIFADESECKSTKVATATFKRLRKAQEEPASVAKKKKGEKRKKTSSNNEESNAGEIFSDDDMLSNFYQPITRVFKRLRKISSSESDNVVDSEQIEESPKKDRKRKCEESPFSLQGKTKLLRRVISEPDPGAVQELSLQKLSFPRIARYIKVSEKEMQGRSLDKIIEKIIKVYNKAKEKRKKTSQRVLKPISFNSFFNKEGYKLRVYTHTQKQKSRLTRELEKASTAKLSKSKGINYFLFFFRDNPVKEIVAATSGNGWQVLRPCVQYEYPFNVVKRILNPERVTEITRRCFVGSGILETLINPEGHELYKITNLYYLVETFKCEVKEDSSLMGLKFFSKNPPPLIKVATGLLRVQKNIPLRIYPPLLNLFSQYVRGEKTYTIGKNKQEELADPLFEFLHFLRPVFTEKKQLDALLIEQIYKSYQNKQEQTVFFRHKYFRDYLYASSYQIQLSAKKKYYLLEARPSNLEGVLGFLDESAFESANTLLKAFEAASFKFTKGDRETQSPLIDYLEGEVRSSKGGTYFKIRGMWYKLAADCHALLQQDFKQLLNKMLIDPEKDEGQLPRAWQGNARKGKLTENLIKKELNITTGIKALMKGLKMEKVCYLVKGHVKERFLGGEILNNPLIKKYQKDIQEIVLASEHIPSQEQLIEAFDDDLAIIIEELNKKRCILDIKGYVINPFLPSRLKHKEGLQQILKECYLAAKGNRESEEAYNRSYLYDQRNQGICYGPETGYLVFDEICPFNVELCDILHYTPSTTYLYHVKEEFGQDTRDACSQILNAAKELRSALSMQQNHCYLEELWRKITSSLSEGYLSKVKNQLEALGREDFFNIFYNRKITFVYAYLEKLNHSLLEEAKLPDRLQANHLTAVEPSSREKIYKALVAEGYLDRQGRVTGKFYASSKDRFILEGYESESKAAYTSLMHYKSKSESTLAKFDLLHLAQEVQSLGFTFKICQIRQAEVGKSSFQLTQESCSVEFEETSDSDSFLSFSSSSEENEAPFPKLVNIGNSCYMNSVLQMLFIIPEIRAKIENQKDDLLIKKLYEVMQKGSKKELKELRNQIFAIEEIENKLRGSKKAQHDAHEFLRLLVEKLDWNPLQTFEEIEIKTANLTSKSEMAPEFHFSMGLTNSTFQGIIDDYFKKTEIIADDDKVMPLKRKIYGNKFSYSRWYRTYCVGKWPAYFIIQLNRFMYDEKTKSTQRNNQLVEFSVDREVNFPQGQRYEIIAYINHTGNSASEGHYTTDIKNDQGFWFNCNDSKIKEQAPLNPEKEAYLVLLRQI